MDAYDKAILKTPNKTNKSRQEIELDLTSFELVNDPDYIGSDEYKNEINLFNDKMRIRQIFEFDELGDMVFDDSDKAVIKGENTPIPLSMEPGNTFSILNGESDLLDIDIYNGYSDVYEIDLKPRGSWISMRDSKGIFYAGTWFNIVGKDFGIYGIRSSLINTILKRKGIARKFLVSLIEIARMNNCERIVAVWPIPTLIPLLEKMVFTYIEKPLPITLSFVRGHGLYVKDI